jgi:Zn-dependent protease
MFQNFNPEAFLIGLIVLILSIALHEFGHAISADRLGDPTPRRDGRVTLWPDKHFDPIGFIMILFTMIAGFGLGWGKPVMVQPQYFRHPRRDMLIVAAFGPLMNLLLATVAGLILRVSISMGNVDWISNDVLAYKFVESFLIVNLSLMFFNLIPLHPLDGSKILGALLPDDLAYRYDRFFGQWGPLVLMVACFSGTGIIGTLIAPAVYKSMALLIGMPGGG